MQTLPYVSAMITLVAPPIHIAGVTLASLFYILFEGAGLSLYFFSANPPDYVICWLFKIKGNCKPLMDVTNNPIR